MKTNCGIYKITNILNNKIYVGSSSSLRNRKYLHFNSLKNNRHDNNHLQKSFNKYGIENFKWTIERYTEKYDDIKKLKEDLLKWEQEYLNEYITNGKIDHSKCYNISPTAGSNLGYKHTEEQNEANRKRQLGKKQTKETVEKRVIKLIGQKRSKETRIKISKSLEGNKNNLGKVHSEETKNKMRISQKGKKMSDEARDKMSVAKSKMSSETKEKLSKSHKNLRDVKVINLTTNKEFNSIKEASEFYNIPKSGISNVCRGYNKTAHGYEWKYL